MTAGTPRTVVVKIGSSSLTTPDGDIDEDAIGRVAHGVAALVRDGHQVVVVSSGAIAAGWTALGRGGRRPTDSTTLQAVAALGQHRLLTCWHDRLGEHGLLAGQVLLAPLDFVHRKQYLHARATLRTLLKLGVVPVVNENDAVADEEIRLGDNDRLSALVAHLVGAGMLLLLTDTAGLLTDDPRVNSAASLIEEITLVDEELERRAGGSGSVVGSGGMATKLAAAKIAAWSGIETVIADAARPGVITDAVAGVTGIGTRIRAHDRRLPARKLWIAFAVGSSGIVVVDEGARDAVVERGTSLLAAGVVGVQGEFGPEDAVEVRDRRGALIAKGLVRMGADRLVPGAGARGELIHRDDLVVLSDFA